MFKNINLEGYTLNDEIEKLLEEVDEFIIEVLKNNKEDAISEAWDVIQACLGCLDKIGVKAQEFEGGVDKHYQKMEERGNKPRIKSNCIHCKYSYSYGGELRCRINNKEITRDNECVNYEIDKYWSDNKEDIPREKKCKGCAFFSSTVCLFNGDNVTGEDKACEFYSEVITNEI